MASKLLTIMVLCLQWGRAGAPGPSTGVDPAETRCDPSLPIHVELDPVGQPEVGRSLRFLVSVRSDLDPDLVRSARVEYEPPGIWSRTPDLLERREVTRLRNRIRREISITIPDASRREILARFVVNLNNGRTISRAASFWIDPGDPDPPAGMIGRIIDRDGTGIRIYRGTTSREHR